MLTAIGLVRTACLGALPAPALIPFKMSGTSLDAVDAVLIRTDGVKVEQVDRERCFVSVEIEQHLRERISTLLDAVVGVITLTCHRSSKVDGSALACRWRRYIC